MEADVSSRSSHSGKQAKRGPLGTPWIEERQAQGRGLRRDAEVQVQSPVQNQAPDSLSVTRIQSSWMRPLGTRVWRPTPALCVSGAFPA